MKRLKTQECFKIVKNIAGESIWFEEYILYSNQCVFFVFSFIDAFTMLSVPD